MKSLFQRHLLSVGLEVEPGGVGLLEASGLFSEGEPEQTCSVFKREPLHPRFRALLLCFKSSPVFRVGVGGSADRWLQENNPSLKPGSPDPDAVESWDGGTEGLSTLHPAEGEASVRRPESPQGQNSAAFVYSIHYASVPRAPTLKGGTVHRT